MGFDLSKVEMSRRKEELIGKNRYKTRGVVFLDGVKISNKSKNYIGWEKNKLLKKSIKWA